MGRPRHCGGHVRLPPAATWWGLCEGESKPVRTCGTVAVCSQGPWSAVPSEMLLAKNSAAGWRALNCC